MIQWGAHTSVFIAVLHNETVSHDSKLYSLLLLPVESKNRNIQARHIFHTVCTACLYPPLNIVKTIAIILQTIKLYIIKHLPLYVYNILLYMHIYDLCNVSVALDATESMGGIRVGAKVCNNVCISGAKICKRN